LLLLLISEFRQFLVVYKDPTLGCQHKIHNADVHITAGSKAGLHAVIAFLPLAFIKSAIMIIQLGVVSRVYEPFKTCM